MNSVKEIKIACAILFLYLFVNSMGNFIQNFEQSVSMNFNLIEQIIILVAYFLTAVFILLELKNHKKKLLSIISLSIILFLTLSRFPAFIISNNLTSIFSGLFIVLFAAYSIFTLIKIRIEKK